MPNALPTSATPPLSPEVSSLREKMLARIPKIPSSPIYQGQLSKDDVVEIRFRIPKNGSVRCVRIFFHIDTVRDNQTYGAAYVGHMDYPQSVRLVSPSVKIPYPIAKSWTESTESMRYFEEILKEPHILDEHVECIVHYRTDSEISLDFTAEFAQRAEDAIKGR